MRPKRKTLIFEDIDAICSFVIEKWRKIGGESVRKKGRFTVAVSGGRTPLRLYQKLSREDGLPWKETHIFLADERFVPPEDQESNYRTVKENLIDRADIAPENVHPLPAGKNTQQSAERYEDLLRAHFGTGLGRFPRFDLIILGVGKDGHTASLFPEGEAVHEKRRFVSVVKLDKLKNERITLTLPVINNAENVILLAAGREKADIIKEIVEKDRNDLPASRVRPRRGKAVFLLDSQASSLLAKKFKEKGKKIVHNLHHLPSLQKTVERMVSDGRIDKDRAEHIESNLEEWVSDSKYILLNLSVHIGMGFVRFMAIPLPLPVGSTLRVLWVIANRIYCDIKWDMRKKRIHSLLVLFFAAIPFLGYFAYTIPLKNKSEYLTYLYAQHISYMLYDRPLEDKLGRMPGIIRAIADRLLVPAELRGGKAGRVA